jgi:hypothetical protein
MADNVEKYMPVHMLGLYINRLDWYRIVIILYIINITLFIKHKNFVILLFFYFILYYFMTLLFNLINFVYLFISISIFNKFLQHIILKRTNLKK